MKNTVEIDLSDVNDIKVACRMIVKYLDEGYDIEKVLTNGNDDIYKIQLKSNADKCPVCNGKSEIEYETGIEHGGVVEIAVVPCGCQEN